jgi:hypothetical protein
MPSTLGHNDLKNVLRLPGTWDLNYLRSFNGRDGVGLQFDQIARTIGIGFNAFNASLVAPDSYWSRYITRTTEIGVEYDNGGDAEGLQPIGEYTPSDPIKGDWAGHMLPMRDYGGAIGWTYWMLRRANANRINNSLRRVIERAGNTWERALLNRLFSPTADTVGGTGVSVPFADGGVADATYAATSYGGVTFNTSHTHFLVRPDTADGRAASANDMANHLREHGIMGPYDLVIPEVDIDSWMALDGTQTTFARFIKPTRDGMITAGVETRVQLDERYIGIIEVGRTFFRVYAATRLPTDYAGAFKPLGLDSPDNPLAVRYEAGYPLGLTMIGEIRIFPLENAQAAFTFGVGVNNRLGGVLTQFKASGSYVAPTIS